MKNFSIYYMSYLITTNFDRIGIGCIFNKNQLNTVQK